LGFGELFFAAASSSALVMPTTSPLSPLARLESGTEARTLPVSTTTPFAVDETTLPTRPPFASYTDMPALTSAAVALASSLAWA